MQSRRHQKLRFRKKVAPNCNMKNKTTIEKIGNNRWDRLET